MTGQNIVVGELNILPFQRITSDIVPRFWLE